MSFYLCPSCLQVVQTAERAPFQWCECGQPLDAVSLLTETVPLLEHSSLVRTEAGKAHRFACRVPRELIPS